MKETYSSNLDRINTVLTIVLAVFTILGIIGLGGLWKIVGYFRNELKDLITLKSQFKTKFAEIESELEKARKKFEEINKTNEEQDQRLKVLEIQEKARQFARNKRYLEALQYIDVALELVPEDLVSLKIKAYCLASLGRVVEQSAITERIMKLESNLGNIINALELYLLADKNSDYEILLQQNETDVVNFESGNTIWYFRGLQSYFDNNIEDLKKVITQKADTLSGETEKKSKMDWSFIEARSVLRSKMNTPINTLMLKQIDYLEGQISGKDLLDYVTSISAEDSKITN